METTREYHEEPETMRGFFENDITHQAEWRAQKAEEYPEDERNARAAKALEGLGAWFRALPDDDPVVVKIIGSLDRLHSSDSSHFVPTVTDILGQFRFDNDPSEPDEAEYRKFLEDLSFEIKQHVKAEEEDS